MENSREGRSGRSGGGKRPERSPGKSRSARTPGPAKDQKRSDRSGKSARFSPKPKGKSESRTPKEKDEPRRLEPEIPQEIYREEIDPQLMREMSSLSTDNAEQVARHLIALVHFLPEDPERAHQHGVAASARAARIGRVRELAGVAAYSAGKFDIALRELKTAFRITGDASFWPIMADCQRGLGQPLKALELGRAPEVQKLERDEQVELRIVLSGARKDLGEHDAALTALQCKELQDENGTWSARLRYAYADALANLGRMKEAKSWFNKAAAVDINQETDALERIAALVE